MKKEGRLSVLLKELTTEPHNESHIDFTFYRWKKKNAPMEPPDPFPKIKKLGGWLTNNTPTMNLYKSITANGRHRP